MSIIRWDPFGEMISLRQAVDKLFEDSFVRYPRLWPEQRIGEVPIDLYQTRDNVVVKATLPRVNPEEVDVSITGDTLTIKGEHKEEKEIKEEDYLCKECRYGAFSRSVTLPPEIKSDKAEAVFENGILTLTIPKSEQVKPKQIKVKAKVKGAIEGKK